MEEYHRSQHPPSCNEIGHLLPASDSNSRDAHHDDEPRPQESNLEVEDHHLSHVSPLLGDANKSTSEIDQVTKTSNITVTTHSEPSIKHGSASTSSIKTHERPKIVASRRRRNAVASILLLHFAPVAVTLVLLGFYIAELPWVSPGPSDNVRSTIQITAKIHEGLIVISLAQIVLHRLRYELMNVYGLPFGYLAVPYQLGSVSGLFSKAFWSAATTRTARSPRQLCTAILILLCTVLAMTCGPASAVAMLPRAGWWPVSNTLLQKQTQTRNGDSGPTIADIYANVSYLQLNPQTINASRSFLKGCAAAPMSADYPASCPYGGWQSLYDSLSKLFESKQFSSEPVFPNSDEEVLDTSVPSINGTRPIFGRVTSANDPAHQELWSSQAYSMTPPDFLTAVLSLVASRMQEAYPTLDFRLQPSSPNEDGILSWKQPLVVVQCSSAITIILQNGTAIQDSARETSNFTAPPFHFTTASGQPFQITLNDTWLRPLYSQYLLDPDAPPMFSFLDIQSAIPFPVSAASFMVNYVLVTDDMHVEANLELCIIDASWASLLSPRIELMGNRSGLVITQSAPDLTPSQLLNATALHTPLTLDADWLRAFNSSIWNPNPEDADTQYSGLLNMLSALCGTDMFPGSMASCGAHSVAMFVADGMARWADSLEYLSSAASVVNASYSSISSNVWAPSAVMSEQELQDTSRFTKIPILAFQQTAGYRLNDFTLIIAMVVLLIHVALVLSHVCVILAGQSWTSNAWSGLGELLALAVRSIPTHLLMNTGAGIDRGATWKLRTCVRETRDEGRLELVFEEQSSEYKEETANGLYILPQPDRKYK
ncbi:hypothetical protein B7463_g5276, partial [Scytalidium lignicola]